jgi:hypothetical protein
LGQIYSGNGGEDGKDKAEFKGFPKTGRKVAQIKAEPTGNLKWVITCF